MGSSMKTTIFNERVATALKQWHRTAKKHAKASKHHQGNGDGTSSQFSSRPATPLHGTSPLHLLHSHNRVGDSPQVSPYRAFVVGNGDQHDDLDSQFRRPHDGNEVREQETSPMARRQNSRRRPVVPPREGSDQEEANISFSDLSVRK